LETDDAGTAGDGGSGGSRADRRDARGLGEFGRGRARRLGESRAERLHLQPGHAAEPDPVHRQRYRRPADPNQFGTQRYALLFEPGTYGTAANPLTFQVGYYTEVAGLGRSPSDVSINGTIDVYNQCFAPDNCIALYNFWRSMSNLSISVAGQTGCHSGTEFWALSQAA
jgi:hypothetical protein